MIQPIEKPGYKTTEFWMSVIAMGGMAFGVPLTPEVQIAGMTFLAGMYTYGRSIVKKIR